MATNLLLFAVVLLSSALLPLICYSTPTTFAVEGMLFCQSCAHLGSSSLESAKPIAGGQVSIRCRDFKGRVRFYTVLTTDKGGYFYGLLDQNYFMHLTNESIAHSCTSHLVSSPDPRCNMVSNLVNHGVDGSPLRYSKTLPARNGRQATLLYETGPLAFRPAVCNKI